MSPPLPRWPALHPHWRQAMAATCSLNRAGLPTFPLRALPALAIQSRPEYASGADLVGPERRRRILAALRGQGYRPASGGCLASDLWPAWLQHPDPPETLAGDASEAPLRIASSGRIALLSPTQAALLLLRESRGRLEFPLQQELLHLVWEQEVDLGAVGQWGVQAGYRRLGQLLPALGSRQRQGRELRRRGEFRSLLPT